MKLTIDTELKTIQIDNPVRFDDLVDLVDELNLAGYDLVPNGYDPYKLYKPYEKIIDPLVPSVLYTTSNSHKIK